MKNKIMLMSLSAVTELVAATTVDMMGKACMHSVQTRVYMDSIENPPNSHL